MSINNAIKQKFPNMKTKPHNNLIKVLLVLVTAVSLSITGFVRADTFQDQINSLNAANNRLREARQLVKRSPQTKNDRALHDAQQSLDDAQSSLASAQAQLDAGKDRGDIEAFTTARKTLRDATEAKLFLKHGIKRNPGTEETIGNISSSNSSAAATVESSSSSTSTSSSTQSSQEAEVSASVSAEATVSVSVDDVIPSKNK